MFTFPKARFLAISCAAMVASCAPEQSSQPEPVDGPTFVSLNPCLDDILVNIAEPEQILALSHYSRDPSGTSVGVDVARQFGVTGGTAEEVLALDPDIVLASIFIAPATKAAFERLGVQVETFGSPVTVADSVDQVRRLAAIAEREAAGEALVEAMTDTEQPDAGGDWTTLIWQPGQIVPGEATLISEHLAWAGLSNYTSRQGLAQADFVSLETLLAEPPDILLVAGDRPGQSHPLLDRQTGMMVADFGTRLLFCGGPTIPRARERLIEIRDKFERDYKRALFQ